MAGVDQLATLAGTGNHRTLAERAFAALHEAIVTGVLAPGERLPIEDIAGPLQMSPMPVREALRRLHAAGLVENIPHRGARVTELSVDDLREIYEARLEIEPLAVRDAAGRFGPEDEEAARTALDRHVKGYRRGDVNETFTAHTAFHFTLYQASGSRWLMRLIQPLWESSQRYRLALPPRYRRALEERRSEHERILAACIAHDADAAQRELYDHLVETANRIGTRMGAGKLFERFDER